MSSKASRSARLREREERAAELRAEADRARKAALLKRCLAVGGLLVLVVAAALLIGRLGGSSDVTPSPVGFSEYGLVVGEPGAPAEVVVYEDFLCPACGAFEDAAGEQLAAAAADGRVVLDLRPISILQRVGPYSAASLNAFLVVRDAAGDEVAQELHALLFADQPTEDEPAPDDDWLVAKAVEAGADEDAVRPGIESGARLDDVEAATQEATDAGVTSTPTVVLDGEVLEADGSAEDLARDLLEAVS